MDLDMLIGHRFEHLANGDLHIHSRNLVQSAFMLLTGAITFILPVACVGFWLTEWQAQLADLNPLSTLLLILSLLLMPALGLSLMVYMGSRESLLLSRVGGEGKRRTQNFFGRRERVKSVFNIDNPRALELRRREQAEPIHTQLWLVMRDGGEHRLTTDNIPVVPGSKRTDLWLRTLADYLDVAVPGEVVLESAVAKPAPYRPAPTPAKIARQRKTKGPVPAAESTEQLGIPARALLALIGTFLAVLELNQIVALVPAVISGRLRISGFRSGYTTFYWAEQPVAFSFNVFLGVAEVLVIGFIAWQCLRTAVLGRMKANP